jgi:hypothetical protein
MGPAPRVVNAEFVTRVYLAVSTETRGMSAHLISSKLFCAAARLVESRGTISQTLSGVATERTARLLGLLGYLGRCDLKESGHGACALARGLLPCHRWHMAHSSSGSDF